ncbi:unnamed protein product, partial [Staurois parvus]
YPSVPPISASQCCLSVPITDVYQCQLVPHISAMSISAAFQCPLVIPVNAHQCHLSVASHQCSLSVPISASQCCLSVPISATYQCHIS